MTRRCSVADPSSTNTGQLVNGTFSLPQPLQVKAASAGGDRGAGGAVGGSAAPDAAADLERPGLQRPVTMTSRSTIEPTDALRTGTYSKTLTFTLSTTTP